MILTILYEFTLLAMTLIKLSVKFIRNRGTLKKLSLKKVKIN